MYHHYFPEEFIALQRELQKHPEILAKLEHCKDNAEAYATIATELGILLDGIYDPIDLAKMLLKKLQERGSLIIRPDAANDNLIPINLRETGNSVTIELAQQGKKQEPK